MQPALEVRERQEEVGALAKLLEELVAPHTGERALRVEQSDRNLQSLKHEAMPLARHELRRGGERNVRESGGVAGGAGWDVAG